MKNCISVGLKKDKLTIKVNENAEFEDVVNSLNKKMTDLKKLYKDDKTPILVYGRVFKNKEINQISEIIKQKINVKVDFDSPKTLGLHGIKQVFNKEIGVSETKFHRGSLRSGKKIEFEGSIVIIGDINGGAEVIAGENIVVLGKIRGLAHAGAKGNKKAIITAEEIDAPQLRISNIVKEIDKEDEYTGKKTYAYVEGEELILE